MHDGDVRHRCVGGEQRIECIDGDRHVLRRAQLAHVDAETLRDLHHALAVCAVDQHDQPPGRRNHRTDHRLDGEGSAALHQHGGVHIGIGGGHFNQTAAHVGDHRNELVVARAKVAQHRLFHGAAGGERAGCEDRLVFPT